jgi:hypothetical protein
MATELGNGVHALDAHTCWTLLRSVQVGRLAVSIGDWPEIFPVNFIVAHGTIVFRTAEGTKLAGALSSRPVAFEVDGYDSAAGDAWSVVVKGDAQEIKRVPDVVEAMSFPLFPWHAGPKNRYIRIVPVDVSGRRFGVLAADTWHTAVTDASRAPSE